MKKLLFLLLCTLTSFSFAQKKNSSTSNIESKFIGTWKGSEKNQQIQGVQKYWIQERSNDGTFTLLFIVIDESGEVMQFSEKGKWWIKDNLFHELDHDSGLIDIYTYDILDENRIKFTANTMGIETSNPNYQFIDERVEEPKEPIYKETVTTDTKVEKGTSIETAIKVKSVKEEYTIAAKLCAKCTLLSQSLLQKNGKFYDALEYESPSGENITYYFDISRLMGY